MPSSEKMTSMISDPVNSTEMNATQRTAIVPTGRYQRPSVHSPGSHESPSRNRRKIGNAYAM